jgi:transposase InsO family protein
VKAYPFIAAEKAAARTVSLACGLLSVSRSAYYQWSRQVPSTRRQADQQLRAGIERVHRDSRGTYGAPRIQQRLRQEGVFSSRKRVARLMAAAGLAGRQKRRTRKTTISDGALGEATDLIQRGFAPQQLSLDQAWVGDITYIRTWQGWAYLATVIDLASRRVVGFAVRDNMRSGLIEEAMQMALTARRPAGGLIFHSDQGSQYTSGAFRELLARHHVRQSLSRPRQCWDNAVAESFFSTLKTELIYRTPLASVNATRTAVFEYIEVFYNRQRLHSALGYQSPSAYEASRSSPNQAAPAA